MAEPTFPARAETLKGGLQVTIRDLRPADLEKLADAIGKLDRESIYTRLFGYRASFSAAELERLVTVDPAREAALVVTLGGATDEIVIATGRYIAGPPREGVRTAEIAFVVEEDYHGRGIAGRLLQHLAGIARSRGITAFEADVLASNPAMLAVFSRSGMPLASRREGSTVHVTLSLSS
jgi:GNAT superfamily N-acetyltransferase